jgi:hypothetical protein
LITTASRKLICNIRSKTSIHNKLIIMDSAHSVCMHEEEELFVSGVSNLVSSDVGEDAVTGLSDTVALLFGHFLSVNILKLSPACVDASTKKDMLAFVSLLSSPRSLPRRVTDAPKKKRNNDVEKCKRNFSNDDVDVVLEVGFNIFPVPRCAKIGPA